MSNNYLLTIAVCSLLERTETFLPKMVGQLKSQIDPFKNDVDLIIDIDNRNKSLGKKRDEIVNRAKGKYIVFVDDDDILSDDYISQLITAIKQNDVDVISFIVDVSINGGAYTPCYYSIKYDKDYNKSNSYHRLPNHICAVKTGIAKEVGYSDFTFGEDADFAKRAKPLLKTEFMIDKVLYYYIYNVKTTTTRGK
jgi:glycosyltransferase involved in cell wall biosynthesis